MLLANTSHELRTPLSRIRLGIELLKETGDPKRKAELERDIAELDGLIEQILLSSRLDAAKGTDTLEEVDLLALAAEEAARYEECNVTGQPVIVRGDRGLLQRMVRNLARQRAAAWHCTHRSGGSPRSGPGRGDRLRSRPWHCRERA